MVALPRVALIAGLLTSCSPYVTGAFGVVSLVRERSTGQLFAMKQVHSDFADLFWVLDPSTPAVAHRVHSLAAQDRHAT